MMRDVAEVHKFNRVTPVGVIRVQGSAAWASGGSEKSPEIGVFPTQGGAVETKLPFFLAEPRRVERAPAVGELPKANGGMKHLVIDDVIDKKTRDERAIEGGVDPDDSPY